MIEVSRGRPLYNKIYKYRWQYLMILPGVVLLFLFSYIPMAGIQVAFKDFQIGTSIWDSTWAGWDNFSFLEDLQFLTVVQNTLYISVLKFICGFPAPILLALLINEVTRPAFKRFVQSVSYLPHFSPGSLLLIFCNPSLRWTADWSISSSGRRGRTGILPRFDGVVPSNCCLQRLMERDRLEHHPLSGCYYNH